MRSERIFVSSGIILDSTFDTHSDGENLIVTWIIYRLLDFLELISLHRDRLGLPISIVDATCQQKCCNLNINRPN